MIHTTYVGQYSVVVTLLPCGAISELHVGIGTNNPIAGHFYCVLDAAKRGGRYYMCKLQLHVGFGRRVEYHKIRHMHQSGRFRLVGRHR